MEILDIIGYPLAACILLIAIHAYFGLHILERGIIFVDLSLAQFIGVGMACSWLAGSGTAPASLFPTAFAVLGAFILAGSRRLGKHTNIEAFIGVLYILPLAVSILILDRSPHGIEEFQNILNGSIVWTSGKDVYHTLLLYGAVGIFHYIFRVKFFRLSREGQGTFLWEFLFFLSFAVVLIKSVQMAGIIQVFAFLIIPVLAGRLLTCHPLKILASGWLLGLIASTFGLYASYYWDLPAAPLIVAALGLVYCVLLGVKISVKAS